MADQFAGWTINNPDGVAPTEGELGNRTAPIKFKGLTIPKRTVWPWMDLSSPLPASAPPRPNAANAGTPPGPNLQGPGDANAWTLDNLSSRTQSSGLIKIISPDAAGTPNRVPGWQGPLPGPAQPPLPSELQPDVFSDDDIIGYNSRTGRPYHRGGPFGGDPYQTAWPQHILDAPITGSAKIGEGYDQFNRGVSGTLLNGNPAVANRTDLGSPRDIAAGTHQMISGGLEAASPILLPALLEDPLAGLLAVGTGTAAQTGVEYSLKQLGLPKEYAEVAGDLSGFLAGGVKLRGLERVKFVRNLDAVLGQRMRSVRAKGQMPPTPWGGLNGSEPVPDAPNGAWAPEDEALIPDVPTEAYDRIKHYGRTPTRADRLAIGGESVDHVPPLVVRYYEGDPSIGEKPGYKMTPEERRQSANDRSRMRQSTRKEQNAQGAAMQRYALAQKKKYGL